MAAVVPPKTRWYYTPATIDRQVQHTRTHTLRSSNLTHSLAWRHTDTRTLPRLKSGGRKMIFRQWMRLVFGSLRTRTMRFVQGRNYGRMCVRGRAFV